MNKERYSDPTADLAISNVMKEKTAYGLERVRSRKKSHGRKNGETNPQR